ncbi:MAG: PAS domain-containing protein [Cyanobacteria bacterium]|nr:PAS domain-containing protein [Cyanobacteriota bacterium]
MSTAVLIALAFAAGFLLAMAIAAARRSSMEVVNRGRVTTMLSAAKRYALGDLTRPSPDYGDDGLGQVARAMDQAIHETGRRVETLERDRARMEAILASMIEGVLVVNEQGRLQLVNDAARRILKLEKGAIDHAYVEAIRHPGIVEHIGRALRGEETEGLELSVTRDTTRTLVARVTPVTAAGRGAVLVLHDITELRNADQVRRDFVANVSHELRTPLTAIKGYAEALLDDPDDAEAREKFLDIIHRHATRMERLVKDLLRLARLDAGQETVEIVPCDVDSLLRGIANDFEPIAAQKQQTIDVQVAGAAATLTTDAAKLHDVARNLIENAVNYTPGGGAIEVHATVKEGQFVLTVADTGHGIAPDDLARVFERFYRVDKSRTRPGGTGLGLSIVKHLVHVMDGEVTASNQAGGGALFTVTLPMKR